MHGLALLCDIIADDGVSDKEVMTQDRETDA